MINYVIAEVGIGMATLYQQIADKFLARLAESKDADAEKSISSAPCWPMAKR